MTKRVITGSAVHAAALVTVGARAQPAHAEQPKVSQETFDGDSTSGEPVQP